MLVTFRNIGPLKEAKVDLNDNLIVICGKNNTGKTYLAYSVYGLYRLGRMRQGVMVFPNNAIEQLLSSGTAEINLNDFFRENDNFFLILALSLRGALPNIFATSPKSFVFSDAEIDISVENDFDYTKILSDKQINQTLSVGPYKLTLTKSRDSLILHALLVKEQNSPNNVLSEFAFKNLEDAINLTIFDYISYSIFNRVYVSPAERSSISLFSKELSIKRNNIVDNLISSANEDQFIEKDLIKNIGRYSLPIRESIAISEDLLNIKKRSSNFDFLAKILETEIMGGSLELTSEGEVRFFPTKNQRYISIHMTASIVKSLASLVFYFRHLAQENDFIIIDEPELNLHPDNQRKIARFLGRVVNAGFKVMISTHSDYIIREINNLVMLHNESDKAHQLMEELGYHKEEILDKKTVGAYIVKENGICTSLDVTDTGFDVASIDEEINNLNETSEKIYYTLYG